MWCGSGRAETGMCKGCNSNEGTSANASTCKDCNAHNWTPTSVVSKSRGVRGLFYDACRVGAGGRRPGTPTREGCNAKEEGTSTSASTCKGCDAKERASASVVAKSRRVRGLFCDSCRVGAGGRRPRKPTCEGCNAKEEGTSTSASMYKGCEAKEWASAIVSTGRVAYGPAFCDACGAGAGGRRPVRPACKGAATQTKGRPQASTYENCNRDECRSNRATHSLSPSGVTQPFWRKLTQKLILSTRPGGCPATWLAS
ncbi:hypothetical protein ACHAXT_001184 [Thalassiosira profunda]